MFYPGYLSRGNTCILCLLPTPHERLITLSYLSDPLIQLCCLLSTRNNSCLTFARTSILCSPVPYFTGRCQTINYSPQRPSLPPRQDTLGHCQWSMQANEYSLWLRLAHDLVLLRIKSNNSRTKMGRTNQIVAIVSGRRRSPSYECIHLLLVQDPVA